MTSNNSATGGLVFAILFILTAVASGCAAEGQGRSTNGASDAGGVREPRAGTLDAIDLDLGEDWIGAAAAGDTEAPAGSALPTNDRMRSTYWGVVLGTYSSQGHRTAANNMVRSCASIDQRLTSSHVHTTNKGSIVVYGVYDGPDAAAAQRDLAWVKQIEFRGRRVFPRAMLSRVGVPASRDSRDPLALISARRRFPNVNPLYTLEVAVWGDFGSGKLSIEEIRERGRTYARELRGQGHEAYVHSDDDQRLTMVTVGLFDHTAIDGQSGLYAPDVLRLMKTFPSHLVNGEPLNELVDRRRPQLGTRVQASRLVLVPNM